MKKVIKIVMVLVAVLNTILEINVYAANYEMKELIPAGVKTTIRSKNLLYKDLYYENGFIKFGKIKNNSKETKKLTIAIGLFNEEKKNIGVIFYCTDEELKSKEEKIDYMIDIKGSYLAPNTEYKDIKYISVLNENENCRKDGSQDYLGLTVEEIGLPKNTQLSDEAMLLLNMLKVIGGGIVLLIIYKAFFTTAYDNMDGDDIRQEYAYINKQLEKERARKERFFKPAPKEVKTHKTKEIVKQEQEEARKAQANDTDLHNFYK